MPGNKKQTLSGQISSGESSFFHRESKSLGLNSSKLFFSISRKGWKGVKYARGKILYNCFVNSKAEGPFFAFPWRVKKFVADVRGWL